MLKDAKKKELNDLLKAQCVGQTMATLVLLALVFLVTMCDNKKAAAEKAAPRKIEKAAPVRNAVLMSGQRAR